MADRVEEQKKEKKERGGSLEPPGWQSWLARELPDSVYAPGKERFTERWEDIDATGQKHIRAEMQKAAA